MKKILVTGGAGYIGSHACLALAQAGFEPVTYDNLSTGHDWAVKWGPLEHGDLRDTARLKAIIHQHRPEAVIHFAAKAYVGESVSQPLDYYDNNVGGTLSLLRAMRDTGVDKLVFSSTCAVYGQPQALPLDEGHPLNPINPYGATKAMCERMLADAARAHGLRYAALRYFNAAGAAAEAGIGEDHQPETHLIPLAIFAAMGAGEPLSVFGTDYDTPDGTAIRDYIHVLDLADAHVQAVRRLIDGGELLTVNLGTGTGFTVRQVLQAVSEVAGRPVPHTDRPRREGDPTALVADGAQARAVLGWVPELSGLEGIVRSAWEWHCR